MAEEDASTLIAARVVVVAVAAAAGFSGGGASEASAVGQAKVQDWRFSRQVIHEAELGRTVQRD